LFALNSPVTRERYSTRLRSFFVYIGIEGTTMEERCRKFIEKVKESEENGNSKWAYACVITFLQHQKDRCDKKEITGSTVRGYYKAVKLFAEVNDILLPWSKIKRGLPRGRHYADEAQIVHYMTVIPVSFSKFGAKMLATLYVFLSRGDIVIHPKFHTLISALQSARNVPGRNSQFILDKTSQSLDVLDSLRLCMYNFEADVPEFEQEDEGRGGKGENTISS
jgi:hypothetical protein